MRTVTFISTAFACAAFAVTSQALAQDAAPPNDGAPPDAEESPEPGAGDAPSASEPPREAPPPAADGAAPESPPRDTQAVPAPPAPSDSTSDAAPPADATNRSETTDSAAPDEDELEFEATAEVEAPPRETTKHTVDPQTIRRMPGTRGDALRAIEVMPGVARTSLGQGDPILRGAAAYESQSMLDGTPVPFLFHFGGLTSFMNTRLVEKIDVYPGNFSVRYGRSVGGIVDVTMRDPAQDRFHAALDLNLIDSSVFVEAPITDKFGVALAARRSNIDLVFETLVPEDTYDVVAAPLYYDYQLVASYRFDASTRLRAIGYGSRDAVELFFSDPNDEDPGLSGDIGGEISFHRVGLELSSRSDRGVSGTAQFTIGRLDAEQRIGELRQEFHGLELYGRAEASFELSPAARLTVGGDFTGWFLDGSYRGPAPEGEEGDPDSDPIAGQDIITVGPRSIETPRPAGYVELGLRPLPELLLTPGVRFDYYGELQAWSLDPRISARYELSRDTALKAGVGVFSQPPQYYYSIEDVGSPDLEPYWALQTSAGVEQKLGRDVKVTAEGFYKRVYDIATSTADHETPYFDNSGQGRIYGGELSGEARWQNEGFAYLAYTLQRSERQTPEGDWRLFDSDQTHILTLAASQGLGRGWNVGARFRLVSGNPTTPIVGATYDARTGVYMPRYGATNSDRDPLFQQLDVRVEKAWTIGPATLAAYLDVQNVYNAKNPEGSRYSFDYSKREEVSGLPLFPNLGLRGEL